MQEPGKTLRFPWAPALLCAACVGAAGWTWMRYSYAWEVTPREILATGERQQQNPWAGKYVVVRGETLVGWVDSVLGERELLAVMSEGDPGPDPEWPVRHFAVLLENTPEVVSLVPTEAKGFRRIPHDSRSGMLNWQSISHGSWYAYLETSASRWHGASIAGLVVGAMGVFVFALHFGHWLRERRAAPGPTPPRANIG